MSSRSLVAALTVALCGLVAAGCSGAGDEDGATESAAVTVAAQDILVAPQLRTGDRYWDTIAIQGDAEFDGVLAVSRRTPEGEPEELVLVERTTGAVAYLATDAVAPDWERARGELSQVSQKFVVMAGDFDNGTRVATFDEFVADNACSIRFIGLTLAAVGLVVTAELVAVAAPAVILGIEAQGVTAFALAAARTAIASPRVRTLLALKTAKFGVKMWLLFSEQGQKLTKPARDAFVVVLNAKCEGPTTPDGFDGFSYYP